MKEISCCTYNARNQNCEISSNQILYLTLYPGECSAFEAKESSVSKLLECAIDCNRVIKLNQVKVDGKDVSSNIIGQRTTSPFNFVIPFGKCRCCTTKYTWQKKSIHGRKLLFVFQAFASRQSNQPVEHHITKWNVNVVYDKMKNLIQ